MQVGRNFLRGQALGNKADKLALSVSQAELCKGMLTGRSWLMPALPHYALKKSQAEFRWADGFSLSYAPDSADNLRRRGILQQETANPQTHGAQEAVGVLVHSEQNYFGLWSVRAKLVDQDPGQGCRRRIQKQDIALGRGNGFRHRFGVAAFTGNGDSRALLYQAYQSLTKQAVF